MSPADAIASAGLCLLTCRAVNPTKDRLLAAAESHFLDKGYCATTVDDICKAAGTTKGAFFHHFDNKLAVALEAVDLHATRRFDAFLGRPTPGASTAKDRALAYVDAMTSMACAVERPACLVATFTLELSDVQPQVLERCKTAFDRWTDDLLTLFSEACPPDGPNPEVLAHQVMASFQGAMVVARAKRRPEILREVMVNLRDQLDAQLSDSRSSAMQPAAEA